MIHPCLKVNKFTDIRKNGNYKTKISQYHWSKVFLNPFKALNTILIFQLTDLFYRHFHSFSEMITSIMYLDLH